ncbi:pyroglutamyl-peptidase I [Occultella glacieicola]|uniref:Pyroglutamyl-peptidase I n=1 Tax=Occultella glacieicola TaxID=2518684 RepID=A0ABY2E107_9MICO|nr:pyroglutamyl-peptidase I [Occultella glacieicola]TDE90404.1 pyroglutamyl-peptidase I [Occultella glacieicola]
MPTVLLTGFEPFDGATANPSIDAARIVARDWDRPERLVVAELPVAYARMGVDLDDLITEHQPGVVIGVGLAPGRNRVSLERLAVNLRDARIPDNDGAQPAEGPVLDGQPTALFTSLPVKATRARLAEAGVEVDLSMTAGTFVCNAMFFRAAAWACGGPGRRAGFVHVPMPDGVGSPDLATLARAVRVSVDAALDVEADLRIADGATD